MKVALIPWPDTFESWYQPLGMTRRDFLEGYSGEWTIPFCGSLTAAGHEVHVLHCTEEPAGAGRQYPSGAIVQFLPVSRLYRLLKRVAWGHRFWSTTQHLWRGAGVLAAMSPSLVAAPRRMNADLVIIQDYETSRWDVLATLLRLRGHVVVGLDTGGSAVPSSAAWKAATRRLGHLLIAANEAEAHRLESRGVRHMCVAPVPIRTDVFVPRPRSAAREELGIDDADRVVFVAARLHPVKNLTALVDACRDLGVRLVIAGEGGERPRLEDMHYQGLELLGAQPQDKIATWMAAADVVALSSIHEGKPLAVLEALACGRGVVTTDVGGVREYVYDDVGGWAVPARDTEALRRALRSALTDRVAADQRGARGRQLVLEKHDPAVVTEQLSRILDSTRTRAKGRRSRQTHESRR